MYVGGGVIAAAAEAELLRFAERIGAPVVTTIMGIGAFPAAHALSLDVLGMHGALYANTAVNEADLVIALGVRFDDRVTGDVTEFIKHGRIIHVDIDRGELNKNKTVTLPICADLKFALQQLAETAAPATVGAEWRARCEGLKRAHPYPVEETAGISPQRAIAMISERTGGDAIVSMGVGQHQMWTMQHYRCARTRSFLSSSGFGTMGFGLPAAIGAKLACPDRTVIDIDGDGSLNMTVHELSTCHRYGIGVKVIIINNQWLGMVRQWQDMVYRGNRSESSMSDPTVITGPLDVVDIYPDFVTIAAGYRVRAERVARMEDLALALDRMLEDPDEPYLLDVIVDAETNIYPMIPAGATYRDTIMSDKQLQSTGAGSQGVNI